MSGDFFFFAELTTYSLPNRISTPLSYLIKNPKVDLVYSDCELWNEEGGKKIPLEKRISRKDEQ